MSENKWVRSVSFNKKNHQDVARLKLIGKKSFSKFIKKLLDAELEKKEVKPVDTIKSATTKQTQQIKPAATTKPLTPKPKQSKPAFVNPMLRGKAK